MLIDCKWSNNEMQLGMFFSYSWSIATVIRINSIIELYSVSHGIV